MLSPFLLYENKDLFCSLLYPWCLEECLAHSALKLHFCHFPVTSATSPSRSDIDSFFNKILFETLVKVY